MGRQQKLQSSRSPHFGRFGQGPGLHPAARWRNVPPGADLFCMDAGKARPDNVCGVCVGLELVWWCQRCCWRWRWRWWACDGDRHGACRWSRAKSRLTTQNPLAQIHLEATEFVNFFLHFIFTILLVRLANSILPFVSTTIRSNLLVSITPYLTSTSSHPKQAAVAFVHGPPSTVHL